MGDLLKLAHLFHELPLRLNEAFDAGFSRHEIWPIYLISWNLGVKHKTEQGNGRAQ